MMRITKRKALAGIAIAAATVGWSAPAFAQATRTWVSGVGDDVNPCSRTAPCKTFAGAISKTAAGGEINCLDPGGYGAVTITKSITINCLYTEGGVLAGGNGIVVNDSATATPGTAVVFLRGLDIFGVSPPSNGVRIISGAEVHIEDSTIRRFNAANSFGVSFQPASATQLFITRTTIANNGSGATGGGILVQPTGTGSARVVLRDVLLQNNANNALRVDTTGNTGPGVSVFVERSQFMSSTNGISVNVPSSNAQLMIDSSLIALNSGTGITVTGPAVAATARVSNTTITGNATGVTAAGGATINTYGNNRNDGNGAPGAFTLPALAED